MSPEKLAPYFVKDETIEFNDPGYSSPSGNIFYDEEDAIEDCIEWLDSEYSEINLLCEMR